LTLAGGVERAVVVDDGGVVAADAGVVVDVVVPVRESAHPGAGVVDGLEAVGVVGPVLDGLERRFGVRVVVALTGQSGLRPVDT